MSNKRTRRTDGPPVVTPEDLEPLADEDAGDGYNAADNSARSYAEAIQAIRMEGVRAGRFLPLPGRPDEIKASPIVEDVVGIGTSPSGGPLATLYLGDSTRIAPLLAGNGTPWIDACVTDPPYELGFMGKGWDSTGVAADWRTWGGVRIALKPGAHLVAFAGSRTYHRICQAIDDAGFEVRDQLMWIYGSGFPKSHDVSKAIDKLDAVEMRRERDLKFTAWMRSTGISAKEINQATRSNMGNHYLTDKEQPAVPTREMFEMLKPLLPDVPRWVEEFVDERAIESENMKRRPVHGKHDREAHAATWRASYDGSSVSAAGMITSAHTDEARRWEGWGTALKPAHEPVAFARKPLSEGTVAANVLRWATGAVNVDGARVGAVVDKQIGGLHRGSGQTVGSFTGDHVANLEPQARWPANVMHDGSVEVLEAFPPSARDATRFFYAAKADKAEREFGLAGSAAVASAGVGALRDAAGRCGARSVHGIGVNGNRGRARGVRVRRL